jgi:two-component system phosphate regulon sensor histidine kinase PhoR
MNPHTADSSPAFAATTLDILSNVLIRADDPGSVGAYLTEELTELTGARCVILIQCASTPTEISHRVVSVNPQRRRPWAESPERGRLYETIHRVRAAHLWRRGEVSEVTDLLRREGFGLSMSCPLDVGGFRVGAMLALGLPDEEHVASVFSMLNSLSTIVALVLRIAVLYEQQEQLVQERTAELSDKNARLASELIARKKSEAALRESEERYRRIVTTASEGIWALGPDMNTAFVNARMAEMLGYSCQEIGGRPMTDFISEEELSDHRVEMEARRRGIPGRYERRFRHKDGKTIWALASATPLFDDAHRFMGSFAMLSDITDRKQIEEERERLLEDVQKERSRLRVVLDTAPVGISLYLGPEGRLSLFNKAAETILGRPASAPEISVAEQGLFREVRLPNGEPFPPQELPLSRSMRGETLTGIGSLIRHPSGREVHLLENSAPLRDAGGRVVGAVLAFQDVTPIREQERLREEFIASAAHELKTPVATIKGYAELLRRWTPEEREAHEPRAIDAICSQTHRITRRVQEMLEVVRFRRAPEVLLPKRFDLGELASQVVERIQALTRIHRVCLRREGPVLVRADRERLEEVLVGLLTNAIEFSPRGGSIEARVWTRAGEVFSSVSDHGLGIARQRQAHVFEPFYEAAPAGDPGYRGSLALSLYLSKLVIERHKGRIWLESEEGKGSTFYFSLPAAEETTIERLTAHEAVAHFDGR